MDENILQPEAQSATPDILSPEVGQLQHDRLEQAEAVLAFIEEGHTPDEIDDNTSDLVNSSTHAYARGSIPQQDAEEALLVGGVSVLRYHGEETPYALGHAPHELLANTLTTIQDTEGMQQLNKLVLAINEAITVEGATNLEVILEQTNSGLESQVRQPLSPEETKRQREVIEQLLYANNLGAAVHFIETTPQLDASVLSKVLEKAGDRAYQNFDFFLDGDESDGSSDDHFAEQIGNLVVSKLSGVMPEEQAAVARLVVEAGGGFKLIDVINEEQLSAEMVGRALLQGRNSSIFFGNRDKFQTIQNEVIVDQLYENGQPAEVLYHIDQLGAVDTAILADKLIDSGSAYAVFTYLDRFPGLEVGEVVDRLRSEGKVYDILSNAHLIPGLDVKEEILYALTGDTPHELYFYDSLFGAVSPVDLEEIQIKLRELGDSETLLQQRKFFPDVPLNELVDDLFEKKKIYLIVTQIGVLLELDPVALSQRIIDSGNASYLMDQLDREAFSHLSPTEIALMTIQEGEASRVLYNIEKVATEDQHIVLDSVIKSGFGASIFKKGMFGTSPRRYITDISNNELEEMFYASGRQVDLIVCAEDFPVSDAGRLKESIKGMFAKEQVSMTEREFSILNDFIVGNFEPAEVPPSIKLTNRYMGTIGATLGGYTIVKLLEAGLDVPVVAKEMGVTNTGVRGLEQFGQAVQAIATEMKRVNLSEETLEKIESSPFYRGIMEKIYRVQEAEFGDTSGAGVQQLLSYYLEASREQRIAQIPEGYHTAERELATIETNSKRVEILEDAQQRYGALHADIISAIGAIETRKPLSTLFQGLSYKMTDQARQLQLELASMGEIDPLDKKSVFKSQNLYKKQQALETIMGDAQEGKYIGRDLVLRSPESFSALFDQLESFDELHSDMRQIVFSWALRDHPDMLEKLKQTPSEATIDSMATISSFVDQIVNNETFKNYFTDKKVASRFKKLTNVQSLEAALTRHQTVGNGGGGQRLEIIPTRGFAMELSGHVGDACWATKYESMAEEFPNMTSLIFKRGEDGASNERLVGSAMVLETTNEDGNPVLLLRGVNPTQNYINKVQVADFYNFVADYCRTLAKEKGMIPAIVIDDHSGGSGTNRPVLHGYLQQIMPSMSPVTVDEATTTFNGYDVTRHSFALV